VTVAFITGISGQDGSYLAEMLLDKGYSVHGLIRAESLIDLETNNRDLARLLPRLKIHVGSLENHLSIMHAVREIRPTECYHLAGPSFVDISFVEEPEILSTIASGTHALMTALKEYVPQCRMVFAGTSEMFGEAQQEPQNEDTAFNPRSIYGLAKLAAYHTVRYYRDHYGIHCCTAIAFNHESPRRRPQFVTRKVSLTAARIKLGLERELLVGNLESRRDWGYAPEYVAAMWQMLQQDVPRDFVLATGETRTVQELIEAAFGYLGLAWQDHVHVEPRFFRPSEKVSLRGDAHKIELTLGWKAKRPFLDMIQEMVESDLSWLRHQR
jgi:GDPmannose 4,6-dehydratase